MRNNVVKHTKIDDLQFKKLVQFFCVDIEASKTSTILNVSRNTVNRYYKIFRETINEVQALELQALESTNTNELPLQKEGGSKQEPVNHRYFGIICQNGKVYTAVLPEEHRNKLKSLFQGKRSPEVLLALKECLKFDGLVDVVSDKYIRIGCQSEGNHCSFVPLSLIDSFWSFCKRRLAKFNGVNKNFELHLKECEWRWNNKDGDLEKELWEMLRGDEQPLPVDINTYQYLVQAY